MKRNSLPFPDRFITVWIESVLFRPQHLLDVPDEHDEYEFTSELTYRRKPLFVSRERALRDTAKANRGFSNGGPRPYVWAVAVELLPMPASWFALIDNKGPSDGTFMPTIPFQIVQPTDEEIRRFAVPASGKRGAA